MGTKKIGCTPDPVATKLRTSTSEERERQRARERAKKTEAAGSGWRGQQPVQDERGKGPQKNWGKVRREPWDQEGGRWCATENGYGLGVEEATWRTDDDDLDLGR